MTGIGTLNGNQTNIKMKFNFHPEDFKLSTLIVNGQHNDMKALHYSGASYLLFISLPASKHF